MTLAIAKTTPPRHRAMRRNVSVRSAERILERTFGLPEGSVKLTVPGPRAPRSDMTIARLRERWEMVEQPRRA